MRILTIITDRLIFEPGSAVRARFDHLAGRDINIDLIVFSTRKHGIKKMPEKVSDRVVAYPTAAASRLLYGVYAFLTAAGLSRPDIVCAQDPFETGLIALLIAWYWQAPLVIEVHTDLDAPAFAKHSALNRVRLKIARFVLPRANGYRVVSEHLKIVLKEKFHIRAPILASPIYIDVSAYQAVRHANHGRSKVALLWVGRMEPEKNPELALKALAKSRLSGYDAGLTMVGGGGMAGLLVERANTLGVAEAVEFAGVHHDLRAFYAAADLLLVTSEYEGYGMVIVEALAAHVPVLSTDVGIAREAGAIICEGDYSDALLSWLSGPREIGALKIPYFACEDEHVAGLRDLYARVSREANAITP